MRFEGTLKSWNDAKGFGFLKPAQGGQDIFVHISVLPKGTKAPRIGQAFSFEIELNGEGKKRAVRVQRVGEGAMPARHSPPTRHRKRPITVLVGLVVLAIIAVFIHGKVSNRRGTQLAEPAQQPVADQVSAGNAGSPPVDPHQTYRCDGRTHCSQMSSCSEAKFFLANCPGVQMDGDSDGTPCEQQWCKGTLD